MKSLLTALAGFCVTGVKATCDRGFEALGAPDCVGLCGKQEEPLDEAGEPPLPPSWTCGRSVGGKK